MEYETKKERLIAITDAYRKAFDKSMLTAEEVAAWAVGNYLWPVPRRGDPEALCDEWERRLKKANS